MQVEVSADPEQMPAPADVAALLAAASQPLGPGDAAALAQASARMYSWARSIPGAATASAQLAGELVGFGYGYSWAWDAMTDAWSQQLREHLGDRAGALDGSFSVVLLVVAPHARRHNLGARLLTELRDQAEEPVTWLQAAADSPTRALCDWDGWRALDPDADPVTMLRSRRFTSVGTDEAPVPRDR